MIAPSGFPEGARCESGWTGDRCALPLFHDGPHDNERQPGWPLDEMAADIAAEYARLSPHNREAGDE